MDPKDAFHHLRHFFHIKHSNLTDDHKRELLKLKEDAFVEQMRFEEQDNTNLDKRVYIDQGNVHCFCDLLKIHKIPDDQEFHTPFKKELLAYFGEKYPICV